MKKTIEVNGKQYDAVTGQVVGVASAPVVRSGRNIDGFFRARATATKSVPPISDRKSVDVTPPSEVRKQAARAINHARAHVPQTAQIRVRSEGVPHQEHTVTVHHTSAQVNHTHHHIAQTSKTLRREGVQRPLPSFHKQAGTVASLQHAVPSLIVPKASVTAVNPSRLVRAQSVHRSPHISHHGEHRGVQPTFAAVAVQPIPTPAPTVPPPQPNNDGVPAAPSPTPTNTPTDIFEHALMNATHYVDVHTHVKHFRKQTKRHLVSMAAGTLALVVIAGFAAYQNTPGLQFKVASIQAGVATSMPNFKAAGFAYNGVHAGNGKLTVGFANADGKYQLTQQSTNLTNTDVIQNISATDAGGHPNYTTILAGNTTVYRFATTDATWVSDGTWYTVNGNGPLSDQQVQSLVKNI